MKSLGSILVALGMPPSLIGASILGAFVDQHGQTSSNITVQFIPLRPPVDAPAKAIPVGLYKTNSAKSAFNISLRQGNYRVALNERTTFTITVPDDTNSYFLSSLIIDRLPDNLAVFPAAKNLALARNPAADAGKNGRTGWFPIAYLKEAADPSVAQVDRRNSIAELLSGSTDTTKWVQVLGYHRPGDGGGGLFRYHAASQASTNRGTVFASVSGGRWLRFYRDSLDILWFGADPTGGASFGPAFSDAIAILTRTGGGALLHPAGVYRFDQALGIPAGAHRIAIEGAGSGRTVFYANISSNEALHAIEISGSQTGNTISNLSLRGISLRGKDNTPLTTQGAIALNRGVFNATFDDLEISYFSTWGLRTTYDWSVPSAAGGRNQYRRLYIHDIHTAGMDPGFAWRGGAFIAMSHPETLIEQCVFSSPNTLGLTGRQYNQVHGIYSLGSRTTVRSNYFIGKWAKLHLATSEAPMMGGLIEGNIFQDNFQNYIYDTQGVLIQNNVFLNTRIHLRGSNDLFQGNLLTIGPEPFAAIEIGTATASAGIRIVNNTVNADPWVAGASGVEVAKGVVTANLVIEGNRFRNIDYAVRLSASADTIIANNIAINTNQSTTALLRIDGATGIVALGNRLLSAGTNNSQGVLTVQSGGGYFYRNYIASAGGLAINDLAGNQNFSETTVAGSGRVILGVNSTGSFIRAEGAQSQITKP